MLMPTGVSHRYYPDQADPECPLVLDDSYFLVKLHDAQAFFPANALKQAKLLLVSSSVESSFMPGHATHSLYKLTTLQRNVPCRLGISTDLTSWLPASGGDTLRITLNYTVMRGAPIKALVDKMEQLHLEAAVSLVRPDVAVAIKISQIVGHIISSFLQEGGQTELFPLTMDLNLADLKAGYYTVLGSRTDEKYPDVLEIKHGQLAKRGGHELSRYSYVVIQIQTSKRLGRERICREAWGELLQACRDEALNVVVRNEDERDDAWQKWRISLGQIRTLARKDHSVLSSEVDAVIAEAQAAVEQKLLPRTTLESLGLETYPDEWKQVLGFSTPEELRRAVRDYEDAVELSERLLEQYQLGRVESN